MKDRIAVVTGASRGIGKAIAVALGRAGATVIGTATSEAGAGAIDAGFKEAGVSGSGIVLDVADAKACEAAVLQVEERLGSVGILVNNAGITRDNLLMRMKEEDWDQLMSTNLKSVYVLSKLVVRSMMKARYGRIINVTSVVGFTGNAGQANYAAAKAGVVGFSKSLARELGSRSITVNCVAPGFIDTDMTRKLAEEQRQALVQQVPLGRFGLADEIASAVAFLASDGAAYITGSTLHVNGGMYMD